jgi:Tfp pilus assembly protein PilE
MPISRNERAKEKGFTLVKAFLLVAIVGIMMAIAMPSLQGARNAADKAAVISMLRSLHSDQVIYKNQNGRYARLSELAELSTYRLTRVRTNTFSYKNYYLVMLPNPSDAMLQREFRVVAIQMRDELPASQYNIDQNGRIQTVIP